MQWLITFPLAFVHYDINHRDILKLVPALPPHAGAPLALVLAADDNEPVERWTDLSVKLRVGKGQCEQQAKLAHGRNVRNTVHLLVFDKGGPINLELFCANTVSCISWEVNHNESHEKKRKKATIYSITPHFLSKWIISTASFLVYFSLSCTFTAKTFLCFSGISDDVRNVLFV